MKVRPKGANLNPIMKWNEMNFKPFHPYIFPAKDSLYLQISLISEDSSILEQSPFPFLLISDQYPLNRLIEGSFINEAGSRIKKVFFLVQRDNYLLSGEEIWPKNNRDIDEAWQRAFSLYSRPEGKDGFFAISRQMNKTGGLIPLQPLFFCKKRKAFFPPPCPECGLPLQQCSYDVLLTNSGLQSYSDSLKRYLFCPSCFSLQGKSGFYIYETKKDDPPDLKGRQDLINSFGPLLKKGVNIDQFPCVDCNYQEDCYGDSSRALSRIVPFSFYPFYMLTFDAMSLNAVDFLSAVSGAAFEEIEARLSENNETGRIAYLKAEKKNSLFINGTDRDFLEILYLKISFLAELFLEIFNLYDDLSELSNLELSLERVWVKIIDHNISIAPFVDFSVSLIDIIRKNSTSSLFSNLPDSHGLNFMGLIWFHTFLINKEQDIVKVNLALEKAFNLIGSNDEGSFIKIIDEGSIEAFLPDNIFWEPAGKVIDKGLFPLWEKSLSLGWSLFLPFSKTAVEWSKDIFYQRAVSAREEVKKNLLKKEAEVKKNLLEAEVKIDLPEKEEEVKKYALEKEAEAKKDLLEKEIEKRPPHVKKVDLLETDPIYGIIMKIFDRWQQKIGYEKAEDTDKTIVISHGISEEEKETQDIGRGDLDKTIHIPSGAYEEVMPQDSESEKAEELDKTIIITPGAYGAKVPPQKTGKKDSEEEDLDKTILLSGKGFRKEADSSTIRPQEEEGLDETVVISGKETSSPYLRKQETEEPGMDETIAVSPLKGGKTSSPGLEKSGLKGAEPFEAGKPGKKKEDLQKPLEECFSTETIIISPDGEKIKDDE